MVGLRSDLTGFTSSFSALLAEGDWVLLPPKGGRFSSWSKPFLRVLGEGISSNSLTAKRLKRGKKFALKMPLVTRLLFAYSKEKLSRPECSILIIDELRFMIFPITIEYKS